MTPPAAATPSAPNPSVALADQLQSAVTTGLRAAGVAPSRRLVLLAQQPASEAARTHGVKLLRGHGLILLGSRGGEGASWYAAGTHAEWAALEVTLRRRRAPQPILAFTWPGPDDTMPVHVTPDEGPGPHAWDVTLHGDADAAAPGAPVPPAGDEMLAAFADALTRVGGRPLRAGRVTTSLTHLPVELPDRNAATALASFNGVRTLRRPARISFR